MMHVHHFRESRTSFHANRQPIPSLEQEYAVKAKETLFSTDRNLLLSLPDPGGSAQTFHRQERKDRKESPMLIMSERLPDRNLPGHFSDSSRASAVNMRGSFALFACFAVKPHYSGSV
jgi:hypothetical protein